MADVQPEALLDLEARLPYSVVITALQGQKHPTLSDAQPRCLAALLLSAVLFTAPLQQNTMRASYRILPGILSKLHADDRISPQEFLVSRCLLFNQILK